MRPFLAFGLLLLAIPGCGMTSGPLAGSPELPVAAIHANPTLVPVADHELLWETVVDVVDDEFRIEREEPVRRMGDVLTEGRLETFPEPGSTLLEPWRQDAATPYDKVEGTLQSVRRRVVVRVIPAQGGHWVDVAVFKELEDAARPLQGNAGSAVLRYDNSLTRVVSPIGEQQINQGWIPQGRDAALEQQILGEIQSRLPAPCLQPIPLVSAVPDGTN
jgi:hypothetical protein